MRRLLLRLTIAGSLLAGCVAAGIGLATGVSGPIVLYRALIAAALVALAGAGFSLILLRTALRRYYEQGRVRPGVRRFPPRARRIRAARRVRADR